MLKDVFFTIWFFLPAGIANMVPVFAAHIPQLQQFDTPLDFHQSFRGKRIFGPHKTWRGLISGIIFSTLTLALQQYAVQHAAWLHSWTGQINYSHLPIFILGPLFAIGALGGDALKSFFKRRRDIPPGHSWFPFDQTDYIIGAAILSAPYVRFSVWEYILIISVWLLIHLIANTIGYLIGLKEHPI